MTSQHSIEAEIRQLAGSDELERCLEIFDRANQGIEEDTVRTELRHLSATDPDRFFVAMQGEQQIGFASAFLRDRFWFLSYLYVLPDRQAGGVGRALLERVLPPKPERSSLTMGTTIEADKTVSAMLYARHGIAPRTPYYFLSGLPSTTGLTRLPAGIRCAPLNLAEHQRLLDEFDVALSGYRRPSEHALWAQSAKNARIYFDGDGQVVGYGYEAPDDWLAPISAIDQEVTLAIASDLLASYEGDDLGNVMFPVAGDATRLLTGLLEAGVRAMDGGAQLIYCSNDRVPPPSYVLASGTLP